MDKRVKPMAVKPEARPGPRLPPEASVAAYPEGLMPEMFTPFGMLALADELPVMVAYFDRDLRFRFLNRALADWLERPRGEILGQTAASTIIGEDEFRRARAADRARALAGERQSFASATFDHPTRGPLALQSEYIPWRDSADEVLGFIGLTSDVTEQRAAERAMSESEARFRRIADSAPVMMWVTRLDRTRDFVNDAYAEFVGPAARGGAGLRLARLDPSRRSSSGWSARAWPAKRR